MHICWWPPKGICQAGKAKAGQPAVGAHLLVAAEGHLPGGESDESEAGAGFQIRPHAAHELLLVPDMLDDVVAKNQVKLPFQFLDGENIRGQEAPLHPCPGEKLLCGPYFILGQIYSEHGAAGLGERQQIASLTAADLQDIDPLTYLHIF